MTVQSRRIIEKREPKGIKKELRNDQYVEKRATYETRMRQRKKTIDYQEEEVPDRDEYICECENDRMTVP